MDREHAYDVRVFSMDAGFRKINAFEMFWHAEGMKTEYSGEITADEFFEAIQPLALKKLADNIAVNNYDLDPATKDELK